MIWQLSKKPYLVIICNPEIGATRYTVHENHQKLSILVLFWTFSKNVAIGATRCTVHENRQKLSILV